MSQLQTCAVAGRSSADVTVTLSFLGSGFSRNWSLNSRPFREPAVSSPTVSTRLRHCAHYWVPPLTTRVTALLYPSFPNSERELILEVPRLRPFVLLLRATCRWRWAWSNGGMILTVETEVLGKSSVRVTHCPPQNAHTPTSYRSRQLWLSHGTAWDLTYL